SLRAWPPPIHFLTYHWGRRARRELKPPFSASPAGVFVILEKGFSKGSSKEGVRFEALLVGLYWARFDGAGGRCSDSLSCQHDRPAPPVRGARRKALPAVPHVGEPGRRCCVQRSPHTAGV